MLINCPECKKEVSDSAPSCPHCGYSLISSNEAAVQVESKSEKKTPTFLIIAVCAIFVAFFTPRFLASIPCLIVIIASIVSIYKKESARFFPVMTLLVGLFLVVASTPDFGSGNPTLSSKESEAANYISKLRINEGWKWESDRSYSHIKGRVTNDGDKVISYFEVTAYYKDKHGNVLDTDYTNSGENLYPNMSKEFDISHKDSKEYDTVSIRVEKVSIQ